MVVASQAHLPLFRFMVDSVVAQVAACLGRSLIAACPSQNYSSPVVRFHRRGASSIDVV